MLFDFNVYSSLLLPPVIQGLLFSILLLIRGFREDKLSDYLLSALLFLFMIRVSGWMLGFAGWYDSHDWHSTFMFYFPFTHWYAFGPLMYFYFRSLANSEFRFQKKDFLHFIPAFIWVGFFLYAALMDVVWRHWINGIAFTDHFGTKGPLGQLNGIWLDDIFDYLALPTLLAYVILTIRQYFQYRRYILEHFSDTDDIDLNWLRNLLYAFLLSIAIWIGFLLASIWGQEGLSYVELWYSHLAWGIIIYYLSIAGYLTHIPERFPLYFNPKAETAQATEAKEESEELEKLKALILKWMETERPYLEPDLTLNALAAQMQLPATTLSRTINNGLGKNFNDFVNEYRVEEVKFKIRSAEYEHLSLLGLAFESGFSSKATFNRAFKKLSGQSPSEYQKAHKAR